MRRYGLNDVGLFSGVGVGGPPLGNRAFQWWKVSLRFNLG